MTRSSCLLPFRGMRRRGAIAKACRCVFSLVAAGLLGACGAGVGPVRAAPSAAQWARAAEDLERLRASIPRAPYVASIATTLRDPRTGRVMDGRGALAIAPGAAVRMVLVGGAGATLLDVWVTRDRWRVAVPPLEVIRRGGSDRPRDLPVAFLRWWFVTPLQGVLFAVSVDAAGWRWLLRDGDAVVDLAQARCERGPRLVATRRAPLHTERVDECSASRALLGVTPGDHVVYTDATDGLRVGVSVEAVGAVPPDPAAFRDPDGEAGGS